MFCLSLFQILHEHNFPVPTPVAHSRHAILMSRIEGYPLRQIVDLPAEHVASLFASLMALIVRLARAGLIHCDFNEFNIMVREVPPADEDEYEKEETGDGVWGRGNALAKRGAEDVEDEGEEGYQLKPGERREKGNGFERIYRVNGQETNVAEEDEDDSDYDDDEEDEEDDDPEEDIPSAEEQEEFDEDGTNEGLKITFGDGSAIEPILIDFPQMVSVEHINAE